MSLVMMDRSLQPNTRRARAHGTGYPLIPAMSGSAVVVSPPTSRPNLVRSSAVRGAGEKDSGNTTASQKFTITTTSLDSRSAGSPALTTSPLHGSNGGDAPFGFPKALSLTKIFIPSANAGSSSSSASARENNNTSSCSGNGGSSGSSSSRRLDFENRTEDNNGSSRRENASTHAAGTTPVRKCARRLSAIASSSGSMSISSLSSSDSGDNVDEEFRGLSPSSGNRNSPDDENSLERVTRVLEMVFSELEGIPIPSKRARPSPPPQTETSESLTASEPRSNSENREFCEGKMTEITDLQTFFEDRFVRFMMKYTSSESRLKKMKEKIRAWTAMLAAMDKMADERLDAFRSTVFRLTAE